MKQQRNTRQRQIVLDVVREHRDHLNAEQVYLAARVANPKISRGTVYRNLNLLVENGEIRRVKLPGGDRFEWRKDRHYHLVCTGCGKVSDAPMPYRTGLDRDIAEKTGYQVALHRMVFEGLCPQCRENLHRISEGFPKRNVLEAKDSG